MRARRPSIAHRPSFAKMLVRLLVGCLIAVGLAGVSHATPARTTMPPSQEAAAVSTLRTATPLLLVHGWSDSCAAFTKNGIDKTDPGANATDTVGYLTSHGFAAGNIHTIGYYNNAWSNTSPAKGTLYYNDTTSPWTVGTTSVPGDCTDNVWNSDGSSNSDGVTCHQAYNSNNQYGTSSNYTNIPDIYLGCLLAHYIYDTFTAKGQAVNILAHSMGGLLVRAAIAFSGPNGQPGYPLSPLLVDRVVTVATPHGGLAGATAAIDKYGTATTSNPSGDQEVADMTVCQGLATSCTVSLGWPVSITETLYTSSFMSMLIAAGTPRGADDALWMLMASGAQAAVDNSRGGALSWSNQLFPLNSQYYPDADFVVPGDSAMALNADAKIYYGYADFNNINQYAGGVVYDHESNSCTNTGSALGWECTSSPYYLNDGSLGTTGAWYCAGNCATSTSGVPTVTGVLGVPSLPTSSATQRPYALAQIVQWLLDPPVPQVGKAAHADYAGTDYPYGGLGVMSRQDEGTDPWNMFYGQCDSYAAWKVYENLGGAQTLSNAQKPSPGWAPGDATSVSPVFGDANTSLTQSGNDWANADNWIGSAQNLGIAADSVPQPGSIAEWGNSGTGMPFGHVGYVSDVWYSGSDLNINVESYNLRDTGTWNIIHLSQAANGTTDTSFGYGAFHVPWPSGFVHLGDGGSGPASTTLPAQAYTYPPGTYGPGQNNGVTLGGSAYPGTNLGWYTDSGHGLLGDEQWTNLHGPTASSTATWSPSLQANTCYQVDTFVPNNWSNDSFALYQVTDAKFGRSVVPINENSYTNQYARIGIFESSGSGALPVELTDQGPAPTPTSTQIAADAVRYIPVSSCAGASRPALVLDHSTPGFTLTGSPYPPPPATPVTPNGWYARSGHGLMGNEQYTYTNGPSASSTAVYTPALAANACYTVSAYVPDNYSNSPSALYKISDQMFGNSVVPVNENLYTNQMVELGVFETGSSGSLTVTLVDQGPTTYYVAADAMLFTPTSCTNARRDSVVIDSNHNALTLTSSSGYGWTSRSGHGLMGDDISTPTYQTAVKSSATWYATSLVPNSCYQIEAYVPDVYGDAAAIYTVSDQAYGTTTADVNQNNYTNVWRPLGQYLSTSAGTLSVEVTGQNPGGLYVSADAVEFVHIPSCTLGRSSQLIDPSFAGFSRSGSWSGPTGQGLTGHEYWIATDGNNTTAVAAWTATHLTSGGCYDVQAFVPNGYATDTTSAFDVSVDVGSGGGSSGFVKDVNESPLSNAWVDLGQITTSNGNIYVQIGNTGPTPGQLGIDAVSFNSC